MDNFFDTYADSIKGFIGVAVAGAILTAVGYLYGQTIINVFNALLG